MSFPVDKREHLISGALLAAGILAIFGAPAAMMWGADALKWFCLAAIAVVVFAAVLKERLDRRWPGHESDPWDAVCTISGGALVVLPVLLIASLVKGSP